jgi:hypothetical protein
MLRQRVPLERLLEWQRTPITSPLLVHSKSLAKEASTTFKVIQHVMGERDRPVEGAAVLRSSASWGNLAGFVPGHKDDVINGRGGGGKNGMSAKTVVLEEVRWMVHLGGTRSTVRSSNNSHRTRTSEWRRGEPTSRRSLPDIGSILDEYFF